MLELRIGQRLWDELVPVAERQWQRPEALAQQVLRDYVQRVADEELLERSAAAARRASFRMNESEEVVRSYLRRKSGKDGAD